MALPPSQWHLCQHPTVVPPATLWTKEFSVPPNKGPVRPSTLLVSTAATEDEYAWLRKVRTAVLTFLSVCHWRHDIVVCLPCWCSPNRHPSCSNQCTVTSLSWQCTYSSNDSALYGNRQKSSSTCEPWLSKEQFNIWTLVRFLSLLLTNHCMLLLNTYSGPDQTLMEKITLWSCLVVYTSKWPCCSCWETV